jgi:predicted ATPase/transcriptional regulator with XRE-family HTH domain/Flp pilus assembly protein TadD
MDRRHALDLTRDELADRIGCAPITIAKIERDERRPSRQMAELLADVLLPPDGDRERFVQWARGVPANRAILELPVGAAVRTSDEKQASSAAQDGEPAQVRFNNLPFSLTSLVGREEDVARVRSILWQADVRLLTLTGPPGIGKTRLAIAVAASAYDDFEHGVCWVPLAPITDPDLVAYVIAQVLNLPESARIDRLNTLQNYLRGRRMLLVLDNFEQVMSASSLVSALMASCPSLKVIATSRERLHIYGEHEYPVSPLEVPAKDDGRWTIDDGRRTEDNPQSKIRVPSGRPKFKIALVPSVALFVQRAQAVSPSFELTPENAPEIAEICRKLDGLPLAIELAAARVRFLSPQALLSRLDNRLGILTGGARDLPPRQQTLRGAIGWSYELLTVSEKALFALLGVFVGGCTLEAIEAIAGSQPGDVDLLEGLASLVDKSLVRQYEIEAHGPRAQVDVVADGEPGAAEATGGPATLKGMGLAAHPGARASHEPRFTMLEMIREYALEQLEKSGNAEQVRERHLDYYMVLAQRADDYYYGSQQIEWLDRIEVERDNMRSALRWSLDSGRSVDALRLAVALWAFWYKRLYVHEGLQWLREVLERAEDASQKLRADGTFACAALMIVQDEYARAKPYLEQAFRLYTLLDDKGSLGRCLNGLALAHLQLGDPVQAVHLMEQSIAIHEASGEKVRLSLSLSNMSYVLMQSRRYAEARTHSEQALALRREIGDLAGIESSLLILGGIAMHEGQYEEALGLFEESMASSRRVGERRDLATALMAAGLCRLNQGRYEDAEAYYRQSQQIYRGLGNEFGIARVMVGLAGIASAQGEHERAVRLCGATLKYYEPLLTRILPAELDAYNKVLAEARAHLGDPMVNALMYQGGLVGIEEAGR